jgi:two-component system OmpR family sensor kinase
MGQPLVEVPRLSWPEAQAPWRLAREASLVGGTTIAAVLIAHACARLVFISGSEASMALAVVAGALALATAAMWHVVRWITGDGRASLCAGAMALYGLVAVPTTAIGSELDSRSAMDAGRMVAHLVVVGLLLASSMESMARWRPGSRKLLVVGALAVLATITLGVIDPSLARQLSQVPTLRWLVVAGWVLAGVRITRVAARRGLAPSVRVGLGLTVLAAAHCYRLVTEIARPESPSGLAFATLRLVGLLFIGLGALQFCKRALQRVREDVRPRMPEPVSDRLALDAYRIGPTLRDVVARHRSGGLDITCDIAPGLMTRGAPELLTKVLDQLLDDSARHAPGSPVKVLAWDAGWRVLVRVSDEGSTPGPAMMSGSDPREPVVADCRALLSGLGGDIRLHSAGPGRSGCTIQLELPVAVEPEWDSEPQADDARFSPFTGEQAE